MDDVLISSKDDNLAGARMAFKNDENPLQTDNPADSAKVIVAALAAGSIGMLFSNILPLFLGTAADTKGLNSEQIGYLATAFFFGFNAAGLISFLWIRKWSWRGTCLAMVPLALVSLCASVLADTYLLLVCATVFGGAVFGSIACVSSVILSDTTESIRWCAIKSAAETFAGIVLLYLLPMTLIPRYGFGGTVAGMMLWVIAVTPLLFLLPRTWEKASANLQNLDERKLTQSRKNVSAIMLALLATLAFHSGNSAVWAFGERMGKMSGFSQESTGALLAVALICGILAALAVATVGNRFGALRPFAVSVLFTLGALIFLNIQNSFVLYGIGFCLFIAGWTGGYCLSLAEVAALDLDGRYVALYVPALGLGNMIGPAIAGWLFQHSSQQSVLVFLFCCIIISLILMLSAARINEVRNAQFNIT